MGWLSGWSKRKSHVISASSGAGTNYQMMITVYKSTGSDSGGNVYVGTSCKDDFGDIRFTASDGTTELDYWMASYVSGTSAIFWVEIAADLSTDDVTIYVYYSNSGASTTSNGINTFLAFDDFTSDTSSNYTADSGSISIDTANSRMIIYGGINKFAHIRYNQSTFSTIVVHAKMAWHSKYSTYPAFGLLIRNYAYMTGYQYYHDPVNNYWYIYEQGNGFLSTDSTQNLTQDVYYTLEFSAGTASPLDMKGYTDATLKCSAADATLGVNYCGFFAERDGRETYVKEFYVRKFITTEPAHSTWGSEESSKKPSSASIIPLMSCLDML